MVVYLCLCVYLNASIEVMDVYGYIETWKLNENLTIIVIDKAHIHRLLIVKY